MGTRRVFSKLQNVSVAILFVFGTLFGPTAQVIAGTGDNYPWKNNTDFPICASDNWGYCVRYCTSWVAWALHDRNGFELPRGLGNAINWGDWADDNGYTVDMTPKTGSVAWWDTNHVAWVKSVNSDNTVTIEEYNYGYTGNYNTRKINSGSVSGYIHFKDIGSSSSLGGWSGVGGLKFKGRNDLLQGQRLYGGEYILSNDGRFVLAMQDDGNLVVYHKNGHYWDSNTHGNPGAFAQLQYDGNFVIYNSSNKPLWNTETRDISRLVIQDDGNLVGYSDNGASWWTGVIKNNNTTSIESNKLVPGQRLSGGKYIRSSDSRYFALMQHDGNFVVYAPGYKILWSSKSAGNNGAFAQLQGDGNFVVYSSNKKPLWHTKTNGKSVSRLLLQSDGNLVLYSSQSKPLWATYTQNRLK